LSISTTCSADARAVHAPRLGQLLSALPSVAPWHAPGGELYRLLADVAREEVARLFAEEEPRPVQIQSLGPLVLPYHKMGAIDSLDLFGLDELILLSFYMTNRHRYRRAADIGANLGLHSIALHRCGFEVRAFEPDPLHHELLTRNLRLNDAIAVVAHQLAVSDHNGQSGFVRVLNNTTGSHLEGAKPPAHGPLKSITVETTEIGPIIAWADLIKLDAEGHEKPILLATDRDDWQRTDAVVEVGSPDNAAAIFEHFEQLGVGLFAQRLGWRPVTRVEDMPASYRDGSLFISCRESMPWTAAK
jgi:FkbM family methyltransferase